MAEARRRCLLLTLVILASAARCRGSFLSSWDSLDAQLKSNATEPDVVIGNPAFDLGDAAEERTDLATHDRDPDIPSCGDVLVSQLQLNGQLMNMTSTLSSLQASFAALTEELARSRTASTQPSSKQRPPAGFVYAQGTRFFKDGSPWYFQGTNIYWLGIASIDKYSDVTVQGIFNDLSKAGIRVIRFWGFGHGWSHMTTDSRGQWTLTQAAWARLDLCVSQASQYGIKVIFPFVNFEPDLLGERARLAQYFRDCAHDNVIQLVVGMQFFAQQVLGPGVERERFYVDSRVFKELANEPHTGDSFEMGGQYPHFQYGDTGVLIGKGQVVGRLVNQWLCRAATYIKSLDQNHMVTTGEEGYRSYGPDMPFNQWLNNGMKGVDYEANVKCPDIDFNTLHVYPDNWRIPFNSFQWVIDNFMKASTSAHEKLWHCMVIREYGCCKQADYAGKRDVVFQAMHQAADNLGFAGTIVWQLLPWSGLEADSNYDFAPTETGGPEVLAHAASQNARSW
ncbi:hypothetical protein QJQ45_024221 [Haematococcus lacustris]|nr:hypothetical protein QJQ45_024221 [Haematococcus lacustris]